ncbi:MAG: hypothetical protein ACMXYM_01040 [Candidatus Woesearchaeota archaeon]
MATPIDGISTVLGATLPFFVAIFVWVVSFALLSKTAVLADNKNRNSIIALVIAIFVIALPDVTRLIILVVPWFFFLFLFMVLVATGFLFISGGTSMDMMFKSLGGPEGKSATWLFIVIGGIILAFAAASVYGDALLEYTEPGTGNATVSNGVPPTDTDSFRENLGATLFNPAIIGLAVFFIIATFTILFLTQESA